MDRDVSAKEFSDYVNERGFELEEINIKGKRGFQIIGPGANRKVVLCHPNGLFPMKSTALWCDYVSYSTDFSGKLFTIPKYVVQCGICSRREELEGAFRSKDAPRIARDYKWKLTKERGWTCPECIQGRRK